MREYLRFFRIPFILVGILLVVTLVFLAFNGREDVSVAARANTECATTERVFDYADVMTDEEENMLRDQIEEAQIQTQCDIVVVTLNESLVEYAAQYENVIGPVPTSQCVMVYADNFYDENKFGYNAPYGDGVLFLDNWYREADGSVYSWMSTCGRAEDTYSSSMIDKLLSDSLAYVEDDPYLAYSTMVDYFVIDMTGGSASGEDVSVFNPLYIFIASLIVSVIFLIVNWSSKKGTRTTNDRTYVVAGSQVFRRREDRFLYKNVTKRKIESNSSSGGGGGGGHHVSSGGHSHGGGGHSR